MVDHYQLDIEWDQESTENQTILVTGKSVTIHCIPGVSYSATVRAVTVCPGIMSNPTSFPGNQNYVLNYWRECLCKLCGTLRNCPIQIHVGMVSCFSYTN